MFKGPNSKAAKKVDRKNNNSAFVVADPGNSEEFKVDKASEVTGQQSPGKSPKKSFEFGISSASAVDLNDDNFREEEDSPDGKQQIDDMNGGESPKLTKKEKDKLKKKRQ